MTKEQLFIQLVELLSHEDLFHGHGVLDAQDEAMMIMMSVFAQNIDEVLSTGDIIVNEHDLNVSRAFCQERLTTLKPMAYILGVAHFAGLEFNIDERALVPRSPIAELILNGFEDYLDISKVNSTLDMCTGSGCIGISIAKYFSSIQCDIADISSKALSLANENIDKHSVKVNVIKSDLFQNINKSYDLVVTNPPYVSDDEYDELPTEYKLEPKLGLVTPQDGLQIPVQIMLDAPDFINDNGHLILEVGYSDELLEDVFQQISFNWIEFSNGGQGVCVFTKQKLLEYREMFREFLETS